MMANYAWAISNFRNRAGIALWPGLAAMIGSLAQAQAIDKSEYHLFNPTPREFMRPMAADRPDTTESPYTVDAGHLQIELSFIDYVREGDAHTLAILPTNFKLGLLNWMDLQIVFDPHLRGHGVDESGALSDFSGRGDLQFRLKMNLWGNDGGKTAAALMPFVTIPTSSHGLSHDHVEGGIILPLAYELPHDWSLGLMAEFDLVYDEADDDYDSQFVHTAVIGHDIVGSLAGYVEYIGIVSSDSATPFQALIGVGLTFALNEDWQLDGGINFGLTDEADDFNPFIGMTVRF